jgi:hypothetical protein
MTSGARLRWMPTTDSGVNSCSEPSKWERKVTPSSSILRSFARLTTWKPPESVSIGPFHPQNFAGPPASRITSAPGRRYRWYVFASTIRASESRRSETASDLTVARVPTGMNAGVGTVPCGVRNPPARAPLPLSATISSSNISAPEK